MTSDILIIGAGAAGCACALRAADAGLSVIVLSNSDKPDWGSNTSWAQGGIVYRGRDDSPELLARDIQEAGVGICSEEAVDLLARRGPEIVKELLIDRAGVPFDRDKQGELHLTEEAAHSCERIIHVADATGKAIATALVDEVKRHPNITLITGGTALDLIQRGVHTVDPRDAYRPARVLGAYVYFGGENSVRHYIARETILATGGLGQIFLHTTNPKRARGDGLAMAYRAGARVTNLEYVQFHPTALYHRMAPRFLLTEAIRGEGGRLLNSSGDAFMSRYHHLAELAPRDVVARAIHEEMMTHGEDCMYLDISHRDPDWVRGRFPQIYQFCLGYGIDMTKQPVPVVPAAHYACGGVGVDLVGRTSIPGLRAIGEVSCTGLHGANRLASTSLLEAITWGYTAAEDAVHRASIDPIPSTADVVPWQLEREEIDPSLIQQDWLTIKLTMWNYVGLVRTTKRLNRALSILRDLQFEIESFYRRAALSDDIIGLRNGVQAALAVTHAAFRNKVSRGGHYRTD